MAPQTVTQGALAADGRQSFFHHSGQRCSCVSIARTAYALHLHCSHSLRFTRHVRRHPCESRALHVSIYPMPLYRAICSTSYVLRQGIDLTALTPALNLKLPYALACSTSYVTVCTATVNHDRIGVIRRTVRHSVVCRLCPRDYCPVERL